MSLPTYGQAVSALVPSLPNVLHLAAPYLDGTSLARLSKVSKEYNLVVNKYLWEDPISILAEKPRPFPLASTWMRDARDFVPLSTRKLVITLDIKPLLKRRNSSAVNRADWNRLDEHITGRWVHMHMHYFPNLRFVDLDGLRGFSQTPLFEHAVHHRVPASQLFELLVYSARNGSGLDGARVLGSSMLNGFVCLHMTNLWYLDVSYTDGSCYESWATRFASLLTGIPSLKVLKLSGLRLTDGKVQQITQSVSTALWSLDLSDNLITDQSMRYLGALLVAPRINRHRSDDSLTQAQLMFYEDSPVYSENLAVMEDGNTPMRPDTTTAFMKYIKDHGDLPSTPLYDARDPLIKSTGLTHLYLSRNKLTGEGIRQLLSYGNQLQVLDIGSVRCAPRLLDQFSHLQLPEARTMYSWIMAGLVSREVGRRLENLRIHHSFITFLPIVLAPGEDNRYDPGYLEQTEAAAAEKMKGLWNTVFQPSHNHRLRILTLTGIPSKSTGFLIDCLERFLHQCESQEIKIDLMKATTMQRRNEPRILDGLRELRLEFIQEATTTQSVSSVSGDQDADIFLSESMNDFTFFDGDRPTLSPEMSGRGKSVELLDVRDALRKFRFEKHSRWGGKVTMM